MSELLLLAPLWFAGEIVQLVVAERYLGLKQLRAGADPRDRPLPRRLAAGWAAAIGLYWLWLAVLVFQPIGRVQLLVMIVTTALGFFLRRALPLRLTLVILTFEGAIRLGLLATLFRPAWLLAATP